MNRTPLLAALFLAFSATPGFGQAAQSGKLIEGMTWYTVSYTKYKPGMADEARKIIYEHFWPVDREIGRQVIPFDYAVQIAHGALPPLRDARVARGRGRTLPFLR